MQAPEKFVTAMFWAADVLGVELTASRVASTWSCIAHAGVEPACRAVAEYVTTTKFPRMPLPAELLELMGLQAEEAEDEADATACWAQVLAMASNRHPSHRFVADPRIAAGIRAAAGDFYNIVNRTTGESDQWMQTKFVRAFVGVARAQRRNIRVNAGGQIQDAVAAVLAGVIDAAGKGAPAGQITTSGGRTVDTERLTGDNSGPEPGNHTQKNGGTK